MWDIILIVVLGLAAAIVAKRILPGENGPRNIFGTALVGIAGSFVGSFIGQFFGFYRPGELAGFAGSIVGAAVILLVYDWLFRKKPKVDG